MFPVSQTWQICKVRKELWCCSFFYPRTLKTQWALSECTDSKVLTGLSKFVMLYFTNFLELGGGGASTPLIPALGRQFKTSLVYKS